MSRAECKDRAAGISRLLPFSPGGGTDLLARLLSKRFYEDFGQTATVDNRPGAGGNLGADIVAKSAPDGYTLLMSAASLAIGPNMVRGLTCNVLKDLQPLVQTTTGSMLLAASPAFPELPAIAAGTA